MTLYWFFEIVCTVDYIIYEFLFRRMERMSNICNKRGSRHDNVENLLPVSIILENTSWATWTRRRSEAFVCCFFSIADLVWGLWWVTSQCFVFLFVLLFFLFFFSFLYFTKTTLIYGISGSFVFSYRWRCHYYYLRDFIRICLLVTQMKGQHNTIVLKEKHYLTWECRIYRFKECFFH